MKIIHLSDIHITDGGHHVWETDTLSHFNRALDIIRDIKDIDAIIITGDLSDDGSKWSYNYVDSALSSLNIPILCCPGNHDNSDTMSEQNRYSYITEKKYYLNDWKFIFLDSTIKSMAKGLLNPSELEYLKSELKEQIPTIICFHHPPLEPGGWLNRKPLENREDFNSIIATETHVKLVLYGHIHSSMQTTIDNTLYCSAPSIGFAYNKDLPKYYIAKGEEGFNLITITDKITIKHIKL